jgi:Membrane proteins related to metalloendopeptidases
MSKIYISPANHTKPYIVTGNNEKQHMKIVGKKVVEILSEYDCEVYYPTVFNNAGINGNYVGRPQEAKKLGCDVYVSIHSNASNVMGQYATGCVVFYHPNNATSKTLAKSVQERIDGACPIPSNRGQSVINGMLEFNGDGYGEIREPYNLGITSVLIETNFHSYEPTARWIMSNHDTIAKCIADSLIEVCKLKLGENANEVTGILPYLKGLRVNVTSPFGNRILNGISENHSGIDLVGTGKNIHANIDGEVIQSRIVTDKTNLTWQWGNYITIQDSKGYQHIYAHLNTRHVGIGDIVKVGQIIGVEGNTGYSFGSHLHYEVRTSDNKAIDPTPFLGIPNTIGTYTVKSALMRMESEDKKVTYDEWKKYQKQYESEREALKPDSWATEPQKWCKDNGISDGTYPQKFISRQEVWAMFKRFYDKFVKKV